MDSLITILFIIILCIFAYAYISMYNLKKCKNMKYNNNLKYNNTKDDEIKEFIKQKNEYIKDDLNFPKIFNSEINSILSLNNNLL